MCVYLFVCLSVCLFVAQLVKVDKMSLEAQLDELRRELEEVGGRPRPIIPPSAAPSSSAVATAAVEEKKVEVLKMEQLERLGSPPPGSREGREKTAELEVNGRVAQRERERERKRGERESKQTKIETNTQREKERGREGERK